MLTSLENIRVILVNTSDCRNIGSAARAMKTMGLSQLILVDPVEMPNGQAQALSAGASDVLAGAKVVGSLQEAIKDCGLVIGTSARSRTLPWPMLDPRQTGDKLVHEMRNFPVAIVFGRENSGLTNEELQLCHFHVQIPANPDYSSLNLAMAVQTLSYEIRMNFLNQQKKSSVMPKNSAVGKNVPVIAEDNDIYPIVEETERLYQHFETALKSTGFITPTHPGLVMTKLRRLLNRARPDIKEVRMLRGILSSIEKSSNVK